VGGSIRGDPTQMALRLRQVAVVSIVKGCAWSLLLVGLIAVACETQSPPQVTTSAFSWLHGSQPVDPHVVQTGPGAQHCGDEASTFLIIGWPLGHAEPNLSNARWYVRNPSAFVKGLLLGEFAVDVTPPQDARYSGYHNATFQLWLGPSDQDAAAYMKAASGFERWPRAKQPLLCI
jgi:hypothetical protein